MQIGEGIDGVELSGFDEAINDCGALAAASLGKLLLVEVANKLLKVLIAVELLVQASPTFLVLVDDRPSRPVGVESARHAPVGLSANVVGILHITALMGEGSFDCILESCHRHPP